MPVEAIPEPSVSYDAQYRVLDEGCSRVWMSLGRTRSLEAALEAVASSRRANESESMCALIGCSKVEYRIRKFTGTVQTVWACP